MTQFTPENLTEDQIIALLQMLFTNMNNLDKVYYDLFINTVPMDITLERYDEYGTLQTYTIPNRAKDQTQVYLGQGSPEGVQEAKVGSFYFDVLNKDMYVKNDQSERSGWYKILTTSNFISGTQYVAPDGDGSGIQNLNMNNAGSGILAIENGGTGSSVGFNGLVKCKSTTVGDITTYQYEEAIAGKDYLAPETSMVGMIAYFAGTTAPDGWLIADGSEVPIATYQNLYNYIKNIYGTPTQSGYFVLPDLRGVFARGLDLTRGYDPDRTIGSYQDDAVRNHYHTTNSHGIDNGNPDTDNAPYGNSNTTGISGYSGSPSETRPKNVALLPCIKY